MLEADKNKLKPVILTFASDERYFPGLYCAIVSALAYLNPERQVKIYILDGGLSEPSKSKLIQVAQSYENRVHFNFIAINIDVFNGATLRSVKSLMAYSRILIPDLIEETKTIYLDSDILVFRDLSILYDWNFKTDKAMAAVQDFETITIEDDSKIIANKLGINPESPYYNSGIIVMDLEQLRRLKFVENSLNFVRDWVGYYRFEDQSAINILFNAKIQSLPKDWNWPSWKFDEQLDNSLERIIHFTNAVPWLEVKLGPAQVLFEEYAARLGVTLDKSTSTYRKSKMRQIRQAIFAPIRAVVYPILALGYQLLGKTDKANSYTKVALFWQNYILNTPYRQRLYRKRVQQIRNLKFSSGKISII